tara:strand:+ start:258 stop:743 length:486 start_codon:yes stop_codon:yes gene_type:complete
MAAGWLYCFRTFGYTRTHQPIYKLGRTCRKNPYKRLSEYSGPSRCNKLLMCSYFSDTSVETYVLQKLRDEPSVKYLQELGREYFACSDDKTLHSIVELLINEWRIEQDSDQYITQKDNERIIGIAKKFNITPQQLIDANDVFPKKLRKKDRFYKGTVLTIP